MNMTSTQTVDVTTTYKVVSAMWDIGKFEVEVHTGSYFNYLRTVDGAIRLFSSRSGARKAITRELRRVAGEPGALHR
jgi:hypothetical protein